MFAIAGLVSVFSQLAIADDAAAVKPPTDEEIRESELFDVIAEMAVRRDQLIKKYAVAMYGEMVFTGGVNAVSTAPYVQFRVVDKSRSFDLRARYVVHPDGAEDGHEVLRVGTKYSARDSSRIYSLSYVEKPDEEKLSDWLEVRDAGGLDPFDDYISSTSSYVSLNTSGTMEKLLLDVYSLVRTERGLGGRLISYWASKPSSRYRVNTRIEFDPSVEMMPVRYSLTNLTVKTHIEEVGLKWKKHKETLVPYRISLAAPSILNPNEVCEETFRCYWLIGDEVPDEFFTAEDHLATIADHFKIPHSQMILGERVRAEHVLPEDLYEDEKGK